MKSRLISLFIIISIALTFVSCDEPSTPVLTPLDAPFVTVNDNGVASWETVPNNAGYVYKINSGEEQRTSFNSVNLLAGDSIVVKALGDGENYSDSPYSESVQYLPVNNGGGDNVDIHTHSYTETVTPPTCIERGYTTYTCSCTRTYVDNYVDATGVHVDANEDGKCDTCDISSDHEHSFTSTVVVTSCTVQGYTLYSCDCGYSYKDNYTDPIGKHTDDNNDKKCDVCSVSVLVDINFYSMNDLHGAFVDTSTHPGLDEFTTYMKDMYADDSQYEVLLSTGDMWQGSVESSSNKGALMTEWMNDVGFVSMTIGNHEYDWGSKYISANKEIAEFPFLAINILENGAPADYCQPSVIVERGEVKIGIIGSIGDYKSSISGEFNSGLQFISGSALTSLIKNESVRLREQGCDLIVYATHAGSDSYDASLSNGYVDLVFEGHTHTNYTMVDGYGVPHIQTGGYNEGISYVYLSYNLISDSFEINQYGVTENYVYGSSSIEDDEIVDELFDKYFPDANPYEVVIGYNDSRRSSSVICQKIAELYYAAGTEHWANYDIVLGGAYLKTREPYDLAAGDVTYAELFTLMPFDNDIILGQVSGSTLLNVFFSKNNYYCYPSTSSGISASKTYYIITDTYSAYYSSNGITVIDRISNVYARDLIAEFVGEGGWGTMPESNNKTVSQILDLGSGYYDTEATVVATSAVSMVIKDGEDSMLVYLGKTPGASVGDRVKLSGTVSSYGGNYQFTQDTKVTVVGNGAVASETPTVMTGQNINSLPSSFDVKLVSISGTLTKSGNYHNLSINGTSLIGSLALPVEDLTEYLDKSVTVTGYITGITNNRYLQIVFTEITVN